MLWHSKLNGWDNKNCPPNNWALIRGLDESAATCKIKSCDSDDEKNSQSMKEKILNIWIYS